MDDITRAYYNMAVVCKALMDTNVGLWTGFANVSSRVTGLGNGITAIEAHFGVQDFDNTGLAVDKAESRLALRGDLYILTNNLTALADDTANRDLQAKVDETLSDLDAKDDTKFLTGAKNLHILGTANAAALLATYGYTAPMLAAVLVKYADFYLWKARPRLGAVVSATATAQIPLDVDAIRLTLTSLDIAMRQRFFVANPTFYLQYTIARRILDAASGSSAQTFDGTQPVAIIINIPATNLAASVALRFKNLTAGSPAFVAYFSSAAAIAPVGPLTVDTAGGDTMNSNTDDLGYNAATNQYLNIQFLDFPPDGIQYEVRVG